MKELIIMAAIASILTGCSEKNPNNGTTEFTELGNPIFAEADLAIECKKIYAEQFKSDLMPLEQRQWYDNRGIGIHVTYIGEIVNVWKK